MLNRFLLTLIVFFAIDMIWLGVIADDFYGERIGHLMGPVNWYAALAFYLIYIAAIVYFAITPAVKESVQPLRKAAVSGAFFGFAAYATYDLTNLATLKGWPVDMVFIDIIWGTLLTASVATVSCYLLKRFNLG